MSKQEDKTKDKEVTTAPGADSSSEKTEGTATEKATETSNDSEAPAWVEEVQASNQAVLDSNKAVLTAISDFNQNASTVVRDIMKEAYKAGSSASNEAEKKAPEVKVNKKAKYEVAKGKRFQSSVTGSMVEAGSDVSDLSADMLQSLLSQGIIKESE